MKSLYTDDAGRMPTTLSTLKGIWTAGTLGWFWAARGNMDTRAMGLQFSLSAMDPFFAFEELAHAS
jgi:hypothetical protein